MRIFASALRTAATYDSDAFTVPRDSMGMLFHLNYSAEGGATATLDAKMQYYDDVTATWEDYKDWEGNTVAFAQFGGVGEQDIVVYPQGVGQLAAAQPAATSPRFPAPMPRRFRFEAVVANDSVTFSLTGVPLV